MNQVLTILAWSGAALVLTGFIFLLLKRFETLACLMNVTGSLMLAIVTFQSQAFASCIVNCVWMTGSFITLVKR